ncbi:helix-turn-helix domain-containing protein [Microbacterium sp. LRZ72]|uniref:helix-turn-helix domain-containing protein n=1 Tax=Microbacterium sp. LRZ72 TaxID=2942481 RepID=UPI0029B5EF70|nr:helix-turn-helix domain-containing protein [Microbacterium sp. LRZ72]MDX2378046.1 helix-turn-helix domain-containing protein [Microbacterium sp. LRZ72]
MDTVVRNPFVTVKSVERELELTNQGARRLIKDAESRGWLRSLGTHGRGDRERWYSPAIFEVIEMPMSCDADVGATR